MKNLVIWQSRLSALLLVDLDRHQRAVKIYSLAYQYPYVRNSKWLDDLDSQENRQVEGKLTPKIVVDCQKSAQTLPPWEAVGDLIACFASHL